MSLVNTTLFAILTASAAAAQTVPSNEAVVAHEWGTFTSVAGEKGEPVRWAPLVGAPDLPCFVNRLGPFNAKFLPGLVRMETPVLYFYAPGKVTLSVHVDFPQGWITEWYPEASHVQPESQPDFQYLPAFTRGQIDWDVQLSPGTNPAFRSSRNSSRYYAARNTDSTPLNAGEQSEKFIFYRGIADFAPPIEPKFTSAEKIEIRNTSTGAIPLAIVFENHDGSIGYQMAHNITGTVSLEAPRLTATLDEIRQVFANALVKSGLFEKEAQAMIDTWHDSWFEEGARVFYIVPRSFVDAELPLRIAPAPAELARVFVGRVEVLSPLTEEAIQTALVNGDTATLAKFGRFLDPFIQQIRDKSSNLVESPSVQEYLDQAYTEMSRQFGTASCVQ